MPFDPSKPFTKPGFDPSQPFSKGEQAEVTPQAAKDPFEAAQLADLTRQAAIGDKFAPVMGSMAKGLVQGGTAGLISPSANGLPEHKGAEIVGEAIGMAEGPGRLAGMFAKPLARGAGYAVDAGANLANAAMHPIQAGDRAIQGAKSLAALLKSVGTGVAPAAEEATSAEVAEALPKLLQQASKEAPKKKWDFPVAKSRRDLSQ